MSNCNKVKKDLGSLGLQLSRPDKYLAGAQGDAELRGVVRRHDVDLKHRGIRPTTFNTSS